MLVLFSSGQNKKGKHKKLNKRSQNGTGTLSTSDRTGHSRDITSGKVSTLPQGEGHSEDATDLSVSSFIQGKVNKKLLKACHKKREQGLSIPGTCTRSLKRQFMSKKFISILYLLR